MLYCPQHRDTYSLALRLPGQERRPEGAHRSSVAPSQVVRSALKLWKSDSRNHCLRDWGRTGIGDCVPPPLNPWANDLGQTDHNDRDSPYKELVNADGGSSPEKKTEHIECFILCPCGKDGTLGSASLAVSSVWFVLFPFLQEFNFPSLFSTCLQVC